MRPINRALLGLARRAERASNDQLVASFVDIGPLSVSLQTRDHQVIYGRRGTGKTHVLAIIAEAARNAGNVVIQLDLRRLGSSTGIYADQTLALTERGTRLLMDLLWELHDRILEYVIEDETIDFQIIQSRLDALANSISEVKVLGSASQTISATNTNESASGFGLAINPTVSIELSADLSSSTSSSRGVSNTVEGQFANRIHFGNVSNCIEMLCAALGSRDVWFLLDEWSEIPLDLQPYLADFLRRTVFPINKMVVKIAAIEQRTRFRIANGAAGFIGIEIGADASASLTLDEFMVFDNNAEYATTFFRTLLWKHIVSATSPVDFSDLTEQQFVLEAFTQNNVISELARASEGVPRDAINIIANAAQAANDNKITIANIRSAAKQWYQQSKESAVSTREHAIEFLRWIIETVIAGRKARAFLLPSGVKFELIDYMYDSRVLHVIKKGVSSKDEPGARYNVYAIDYGCYVDLISTTNAPVGLFEAVVNEDEVAHQFIDVPTTDYRSIRRAILDVTKFRPSSTKV